MIVNISSAPVVIGRFRILPGAKFPDVPKTSEETLAVEKLLKKGILKRMSGMFFDFKRCGNLVP